jgi:hypothetical protein
MDSGLDWRWTMAWFFGLFGNRSATLNQQDGKIREEEDDAGDGRNYSMAAELPLQVITMPGQLATSRGPGQIH